MSEYTDSMYAAKADVAMSEPRDHGEIRHALDSLDKRVCELRERLSLLEDRIGPVLVPPVAEVEKASLDAVSPPRSDVAQRVWGLEGDVARVISRLMDITPRVDL